ncbi:hypothetical protein RSAG8_13006, partial [Rhizoctonia solani AG-8 WAC10335]
MLVLNHYTNIWMRACQNRNMEILAGTTSTLDATDKSSTGLDDVRNSSFHLPRISSRKYQIDFPRGCQLAYRRNLASLDPSDVRAFRGFSTEQADKHSRTRCHDLTRTRRRHPPNPYNAPTLPSIHASLAHSSHPGTRTWRLDQVRGMSTSPDAEVYKVFVRFRGDRDSMVQPAL